MSRSHTTTRKLDLEALELKIAAEQKDSTHNFAAQASAGIFIRILRAAYSDIKPLLEEDPAQRGAQASLIDYLNKVIEKLENNTKDIGLSDAEEKSLSDSDIKGTIELIKRIQQLDTYPSKKKISVFKQMRSIAKTCPGLWDPTNDNHKRWSTNAIYNVNTMQDELEMCSPAETLNLVSRALLDQSRYLIQKSGEDTQAKTEARIILFCGCCVALQDQVDTQQFEKCSTGRQHDLVFLLQDWGYLDKPNTQPDAKPLNRIWHVNLFLFKSFDHFLEKGLSGLPEENRSRLIRDWMLLEQKEETEKHPALEFLQKKYPRQFGIKDPNSGWKSEAEKSLIDQCAAYCINAQNIKNELAKWLTDFADNIENYSCPAMKSTLSPLLQVILKNTKLPPTQQLAEIDTLITLRNKTLDHFRAEIKNKVHSPDLLEPHAEFIRRFYVGLQLFDSLYHYHALSETEEVGIDGPFFQVKHRALLDILPEYFNQLNEPLSEKFSQAFDTIKANYWEAEKEFKAKLDIVHFFADLTPDNVELEFARARALASEKKADPIVFVKDETLKKWCKDHSTSDALLLSTYEINRILLHAITKSFLDWSPDFCDYLRFVTQSLLVRPPEEDYYADFSRLKRIYPPSFLNNLLFILDVQESSLDRDLKDQFTQLLVNKKKMVYENLFIELFSFQENVLSRDLRIGILDFMGRDKINQRKKNGATALYVAVEYGNDNHDSVIQKLLDQGADLNLGLNNGFTPLTVAAEQEHAEVVRILIDHYIKLNTEEKTGCHTLLVNRKLSLIHFFHILKCLNPEKITAMCKCNNDAKDLLSHLCGITDINTMVKSLKPEQIAAVCNIKPRVFLELLYLPQDALSADQLIQIFDLMKIEGDQFNEISTIFEPILFVAAKQGRHVLVQKLLEKGADPNLTGSRCAWINNGDVTPLIIAATQGHEKVVRVLIDHHIKLNTEEKTDSNTIQVDLLKAIKSMEDFVNVARHLNPEQLTAVCNSNRHIQENLQLIFKTGINHFTPAQLTTICNSRNFETYCSENIKNGSDFYKFFITMSPEKIKAVCNNNFVQAHLSRIIQNKENFCYTLRCLTSLPLEKRIEIFKSPGIQGLLPQSINSVKDLCDIITLLDPIQVPTVFNNPHVREKLPGIFKDNKQGVEYVLRLLEPEGQACLNTLLIPSISDSRFTTFQPVAENKNVPTESGLHQPEKTIKPET